MASNDQMTNEAATDAPTTSSSTSTSTSNGNSSGTTSNSNTNSGAVKSTECSTNSNDGATTGGTGAPVATKQKKTVTFKNILETSDDKSVVKRFYNPDNRVPLVSIMKKDSMNRPLAYCRGSEFIVRPSILSKILYTKNSNIDKLNSLKFRSVPATTASTHDPTAAFTSTSSSTSASSTSTSLFGSGLSRVFGAPLEDEDDVSGGVTFRKHESHHKTTNKDNDDDG